MKETIVHLVSGRRYTGAAAYALSWHQALVDYGFSSIFIYEGGHNLEERLGKDPTAYPVRKGLRLSHLIQLVPSPFLLLAHLSRDHFWCLKACPSRSIPILHRPRFWRKFFPYSFFPLVLFAYGTKPLKDFLPPALTPPSHAPLPLKERRFTLGTIGKLTEDRHHRWVLDVYCKLQERDPQATLVVLGKGPERRHLERIVESRGIAQRVNFAGYHEDDALHRWYQEIKVLLWPAPGSQYAHRALPEAALQGCLMAAPPMPYVESWIRHEETGLILPYTPSQAAEKIYRWLKNPKKCQDLADRGHEYVNKVTHPHKVAKELIKRLLPFFTDRQKSWHKGSTRS